MEDADGQREPHFKPIRRVFSRRCVDLMCVSDEGLAFNIDLKEQNGIYYF